MQQQQVLDVKHVKKIGTTQALRDRLAGTHVLTPQAVQHLSRKGVAMPKGLKIDYKGNLGFTKDGVDRRQLN